MVGHGLGDRRPRLHPALSQQVVDQHRMVDDLVVASELPVLVLQRVEAVGTGRDDLLHAVSVERLDVGLRLHLEQELVADAPRGIPRAPLLFPQDGKIHPAGLQHLREGPGDLLGALVKGRGAAHPVQVLRRPLLGHQGDIQVPGPLRPRRDGALVGVAAALHPPHGRLHRLRESRLLHDQEAPHVDDLRNRLDEDRALLVAGAAGGARPDHILADHAAHQGLAVPVPLAMGQQVVAKVDDEPLRRERLPRRPGGAGVLTPAALGAGHEVQEVLARKRLDRRDPEVFRLLQRHRLDHARGLWTAQGDVGRCRQDVTDQRVGEERDEPKGQHRVAPPGHPVPQGLLGLRETGKAEARQPSPGRPEAPGVPGGHDPQPLDREPADQDGEEHPEEKAVSFGVPRFP